MGRTLGAPTILTGFGVVPSTVRALVPSLFGASIMIKPIPDQSEATPTAARRLRPVQAAPTQRDPREDMCIDECLGGIGASRRFKVVTVSCGEICGCDLCCVD